MRIGVLTTVVSGTASIVVNETGTDERSSVPLLLPQPDSVPMTSAGINKNAEYPHLIGMMLFCSGSVPCYSFDAITTKLTLLPLSRILYVSN